MSIHRFEITPWYAMGVKRLLDVRSDQTLLHLHHAIQAAFELGDVVAAQQHRVTPTLSS